MSASTLPELCVKMQDLTMAHCRKTCHRLGSCCSPEYCTLAIEEAAKDGVVLAVNPATHLLLDPTGHCQAAPHYRPLCTLHQCDIASNGWFDNDPEGTEEYFRVREQIAVAMPVDLVVGEL